MHNFMGDELAKRDFLTSLGVWIVIEIVCFVLFPRIGLIDQTDRLQSWFMASVPLGLGGAIMLAASSRILVLAGDENNRSKRSSRMMLGQIGGWLGILGLLFPLVMVAYEFFVTAADRVNQS